MQYFDVMRDFFVTCYQQQKTLVTSAVTVEEYCVFPLSCDNMQAVYDFDNFLSGMGVKVILVDKTVALNAAKIRAEYKGFKALDAIHLVTAELAGCDLFLTNDYQLRQIKSLKVMTADDLKSHF